MEHIRVTRFGGSFTPTPEERSDLKALIEQCNDLYPGIEAWYKKKVLTGLKDKERTAYLIYSDEKPVGATVLKLGDDAKICSFRILPDAERMGYGKLLMALLARDLRSCGDTFHFTIPENIWADRSDFFQGYGMGCLGPSKGQYRLFDPEFYGQGTRRELWRRVVETLPDLMKKVTVNGFKSRFDLVMSIHPALAKAIMKGEKRVEIRRKFSEKWIGSHTLVYSTSPENSFIGSFRIANVVEGKPEEIWQTFGDEIGCSKENYMDYSRGTDNVYAIVVSDTSEFKAPMLRTGLSHMVETDIRAPQSYARYKERSVLDEAISIQALLQSTL